MFFSDMKNMEIRELRSARIFLEKIHEENFKLANRPSNFLNKSRNKASRPENKNSDLPTLSDYLFPYPIRKIATNGPS